MEKFLQSVVGDSQLVANILAILFAVVAAVWAVWLYVQSRKKYNTPENEVVYDLALYLNNKGVLKNEFEWEIAGPAFRSLQEIREELSTYLTRLKQTSPFFLLVKDLQELCRLAVNNPKIFPHGADTSIIRVTENASLMIAIDQIRRKYGELVSKANEKYSINFDSQRSEPNFGIRPHLPLKPSLGDFPVGARINVTWALNKKGGAQTSGVIIQASENKPLYHPEGISICFIEDGTGVTEIADSYLDTVKVIHPA